MIIGMTGARCLAAAAILFMLAARPAHGQEADLLVRDAVRLGLAANGLLEAPRGGPVWFDMDRSGSFVEHFGLDFETLSRIISEQYHGRAVMAVENYEAALEEGPQDDPTLLELHAAARARGASVPPIPRSERALPTRWVRGDGVTVELRLIEVVTPGRVRLEAGFRHTSFFFMPVGTSVGFDAEWTGTGWRLVELYRKLV